MTTIEMQETEGVWEPIAPEVIQVFEVLWSNGYVEFTIGVDLSEPPSYPNCRSYIERIEE